MENLNLNSNETIIHTTQTLIINGVRHEAVLTSQRLILVESETGQIHEDIPYADIRLAASGINKIREPIITVNFNIPKGEERTLELIFLRSTGNLNLKDIERCLTILKDHDVPVKGKVQPVGSVHRDSGEKGTTDVQAMDETPSRPAVPEWSYTSTSHQIRNPLKEEPKERSILFSITALILVFVVIVGGAVVMGKVLNSNTAPSSQNETGSEVVSNGEPILSPTPTPTPQPEETETTAVSAPEITIPTTGIWVRVSCPGNYSGYIGARGRNIEINSSGTQFYQLSVENTMIEGSIEKLDGSSDTLEVGIYNGGEPVLKTETAKPWGLIDIHIPVGPAIGLGAAVPPPTPVIEATPTPDISLPGITIPTPGVFVRVFYPGNYVGYINSKGRLQDINSSGDQLYQVPIESGMIDGSIEKQDGSGDTMVIEIYKDGTLLSRSDTSRPFGQMDIHYLV
ncbi:MAG: hypothetical protein CVV34_01160 [Methanomicrobiales archaeon HGW-Methanomicrobiales-5]|nr:MAG: hypothetical protein CVV34_01160 [Methanomicrobiales archaeon HGW-Methanomicrobiales-5]